MGRMYLHALRIQLPKKPRFFLPAGLARRTRAACHARKSQRFQVPNIHRFPKPDFLLNRYDGSYVFHDAAVQRGR